MCAMCFLLPQANPQKAKIQIPTPINGEKIRRVCALLPYWYAHTHTQTLLNMRRDLSSDPFKTLCCGLEWICVKTSVLPWHPPPLAKCDTGESGAALGFSANQGPNQAKLQITQSEMLHLRLSIERNTCLYMCLSDSNRRPTATIQSSHLMSIHKV